MSNRGSSQKLVFFKMTSDVHYTKEMFDVSIFLFNYLYCYNYEYGIINIQSEVFETIHDKTVCTFQYIYLCNYHTHNVQHIGYIQPPWHVILSISLKARASRAVKSCIYQNRLISLSQIQVSRIKICTTKRVNHWKYLFEDIYMVPAHCVTRRECTRRYQYEKYMKYMYEEIVD